MLPIALGDFPEGNIGTHGMKGIAHGRPAALFWAEWIMKSWWGRVKNCGTGLCPMCYHPGGTHRTGERGLPNVGIQGIPGRAGTVRADVRAGTREASRVAGQNDECAGAGGSARGVLHQPKESRTTGDGHTSDRTGVDAREGVGAIGDGRVEESAGGETRSGGGGWRRSTLVAETSSPKETSPTTRGASVRLPEL